MESRITELELKVLHEVSSIIGQALDLDQTLERVLAILSDTLAMKRGTVTLLDPEDGLLVIRASHGLTPEEKNRGVYRTDEGVTGLVFQTAQSRYIPDISKEPLFLDRTLARREERGRVSFIGVPIMVHGKPMGVISVDRIFSGGIDPAEDERFLTILAGLIGQFVSLNQEVAEREAMLKREIGSLKNEISERYNNFFMVGKSPAMLEVKNLVEKVAPSKASVLLLGESGTGKTLVARIIHELSKRARCPFVKVNCAALPENLLESELFGHEKGAFTGAVGSKSGRFEQADGGSIFLDEIAELTLPLQAKLLRFLQEREFERLGSTKTRKVDVRIVAATNADLAEAVDDGRFREDLYYRLNVFPIQLPPLKERREDIPLLIDYFLDKFSGEYGRRLTMASQAAGVLANYGWPGNVREMENLFERLAIMCEGERISLNDLPSYLFYRGRAAQGRPENNDSLSRLEEMEKREVVAALERNNWIQSHAASELGLTLRQIGYRVKKFGLEHTIKERRRSISLS